MKCKQNIKIMETAVKSVIKESEFIESHLLGAINLFQKIQFIPEDHSQYHNSTKVYKYKGVVRARSETCQQKDTKTDNAVLRYLVVTVFMTLEHENKE